MIVVRRSGGKEREEIVYEVGKSRRPVEIGRGVKAREGCWSRDMDGFLRGAAADGIATFMWVFLSSALFSLTPLVSSSSRIVIVLLNAVVAAALTSAFDLVGGGSYNPSCAAAFFLAGMSPVSGLHLAFSLPFQVVAASAALVVLLRLFPFLSFSPPTTSVTVSAAALAEGLFTFLMVLAIILAVSLWPRRVLLRNSLLALLNTLLLVPFAPITGGSMNPAAAFAWDYVKDRLADPGRFYVYWVGPYAGAAAAGLVYRLLAPGVPRRRRQHNMGGAVAARRGGELALAVLRGLRQGSLRLPAEGNAPPRAAEVTLVGVAHGGLFVFVASADRRRR